MHQEMFFIPFLTRSAVYIFWGRSGDLDENAE